jgi:hypothetical protein
VRKYFFEVLSLVLILGGLGFFLESVSWLSRHDYTAAILLVGVGIAVTNVGLELARLALVERE